MNERQLARQLENAEEHFDENLGLTSRQEFIEADDDTFAIRQVNKGLSFLKPGVYEIGIRQGLGLVYSRLHIDSDKLIAPKEGPVSLVLKELNHFWSSEVRTKYKEYGYTYKRGILMYGPAGTGKTSAVNLVCEQIASKGGIVLFNPDPSIFYLAVRKIRLIQKDVPIVGIFEEFEGLANNSSVFKSLLDGQLQLENVVVLATTNYIDQVPATIKCRPSRFATVIEVGAPNAEVRRHYLTNKLIGKSTEEVETWVTLTNGFVLDQIKDLIISVECMGLTLDDAVSRLKKYTHSENDQTSTSELEYELSSVTGNF